MDCVARACVCVCVCVCEREREREREQYLSNTAQQETAQTHFLGPGPRSFLRASWAGRAAGPAEAGDFGVGQGEPGLAACEWTHTHTHPTHTRTHAHTERGVFSQLLSLVQPPMVFQILGWNQWPGSWRLQEAPSLQDPLSLRERRCWKGGGV